MCANYILSNALKMLEEVQNVKYAASVHWRIKVIIKRRCAVIENYGAADNAVNCGLFQRVNTMSFSFAMRRRFKIA